MLRKSASVVLMVSTFLFWPLFGNAEPRVLSPFYRGTQLQGLLFGVGLVELPDYVLNDDIAFPYRKKPGFTREIPFADSFVINRVMGGYREDGLRKFGRWDEQLGRRSLDYATKLNDGKLRFRPDLLKARLQPYLDVGYKPSDITLALDNPPWDLATPDRRPPKEGEWGRNTPPGDLEEWQAIVRRLALDLKAYLGAGAEHLSFETGPEYDEKASFDGDAETFFRYYAATDRALHSVLPSARLSPGEFTAAGVCTEANPNCVYDTKAFINFARREHLAFDNVPRSLHSLLDVNKAWPSEAAERSVDSYRRLPPVVAEIHQFGLLFEPFGDHAGGDPGPMQASWEFQTLARLMTAGPPRRVFHWGGFVSVGKLMFLNGSGFLRLVLDHYLGREVTILPSHDTEAQRPFAAETVAVALTEKTSVALLISSFSPRPVAGARPVTIVLPEVWKGKDVKIVRYRGSQNVFASLKQDLTVDNNLRPEFAACPLCLGQPILMASDVNRARRMINENAARYEAQMHESLKWAEQYSDVSVDGRQLTVGLEANELLIVEPRN